MNLVTISLLGLVLGFAAFQKAAADLRDWNYCLVALGVIAVFHFAPRRTEKVPRLDAWAVYSLATVLGLAVLQVMPLPSPVVGLLSPVRLELFQAAQAIAGAGSGSWLTLSALPKLSMQYILVLAGYTVVFLVVRDATLRLKDNAWVAAWPLLLVAAAEALLGVAQWASGATVASGASGTYASRDHYVGLLEMVLPFAALYPVVILRSEETRYEVPAGAAMKAAGVAGAGALILGGILFSLSRMGFVCALVALVTAALGGLFASRDPEQGSPIRTIISMIAITAVICGGMWLLLNGDFLGRFASLADSGVAADETRTGIWRDTTGLIRDYPLFGCGLGGFESCFQRYKKVAPMLTIDYAHNDYLQVLAEFGLLGFLAGLVFVLRVVQRAAKGFLWGRDVPGRLLALAALAGMLAMLLHSLVDFNMYVPANGMVYAWIAGIAGVNLRKRKSRERR